VIALFKDVVWLDFPAPHKHMTVDVTATSACTNSIVLAVGVPLPVSGRLALGAEQAKLDADIRTLSALGAPSIHVVFSTSIPLLSAYVQGSYLPF
jgi:hypothetical protein